MPALRHPAGPGAPFRPRDEDGTVRHEADARLAAFLDHRKNEAVRTDHRFAREVVDRLAAFTLGGGKRIRPLFAWWGWRAGGGRADGPAASAALHAAAALELIQACALIQDDVMDDSDVRRGAPSVHVAFAASHRDGGWPGDPERFGRSAAVLAGDLALVWADDMFGDALDAHPAVRARAREPWRAMRTEMIAGQYLDIRAQSCSDDTEATALRVNRLKTAAYSVERPLHFGAAMANASPESVDALRAYGAAVGSAFQLRDDLLDLYGDPSVTGKPVGGDLREGKRTLLAAVGMRKARGCGDLAAVRELDAAIGAPDLTDGDARGAAALLDRLGAKAAVQERMRALLDEAADRIESAPLDAQARDALLRMASSAASRTS